MKYCKKGEDLFTQGCVNLAQAVCSYKEKGYSDDEGASAFMHAEIIVAKDAERGVHSVLFGVEKLDSIIQQKTAAPEFGAMEIPFDSREECSDLELLVALLNVTRGGNCYRKKTTQPDAPKTYEDLRKLFN